MHLLPHLCNPCLFTSGGDKWTTLEIRVSVPMRLFINPFVFVATCFPRLLIPGLGVYFNLFTLHSWSLGSSVQFSSLCGKDHGFLIRFSVHDVSFLSRLKFSIFFSLFYLKFSLFHVVLRVFMFGLSPCFSKLMFRLSTLFIFCQPNMYVHSCNCF